MRQRFSGQIAGVGTTSGIRLVVGHWADTPLGAFSDVMVEGADGRRVLLAPSDAVRDVIEATYVFDEVRVEPVTVLEEVGPRHRWAVRSPSLALDLTIGRRTGLGLLLQPVPDRVATSTWWASALDPLASRLVRGVRTHGVARPGREEWYGATDVHAVVAVSGAFDGEVLGRLAPVDPPCRFGFSSTPCRPCVTRVVTTIEQR